MRKLDVVILILALMLVLMLSPAVIYAYQTMYSLSQRTDVINLVMRTPENGNMTPRVIRVKKGDLVRLRVTSEDVAHGFRIKEWGVKVFPIEPGKFTTIEFVAEEAGTFDFFCNIICSPSHMDMRGQLIVEE